MECKHNLSIKFQTKKKKNRRKYTYLSKVFFSSSIFLRSLLNTHYTQLNAMCHLHAIIYTSTHFHSIKEEEKYLFFFY